ncbi:hypothetical protein V8B97DRAFT_791151 [Scleroderma yunnanense]
MTETRNVSAALPAAAILSRVLFDTHERYGLRTENKEATSPILMLPTELLLEIFVCLYSEYYQESSQVQEESNQNSNVVSPTHKAWFDPQSPSLFPYNVASVCRQWRDILCSPSLPTFWTRVVIFVGITTPGAIQEILSWSRNLPVELSVVQQVNSFSPAGTTQSWNLEAEDVKYVTRSILPHIKRFTTIKYSLFHSSSLAMVRMTLSGTARLLKTLHMEYENDDGDGGYEVYLWLPNFNGGQPPLTGWKLITHAVEHLSVDNYTFKLACYPKSDGFHDLMRLRSLTLSWPSPHPRHEQPTISRHGRIRFDGFMLVLQEATMLTSLTVRNEQFDAMEQEDVFPIEYDLPWLRFVNFDGVSKRFLTHFHRSVNVDTDNLVIVHLSISDSPVE